MYSYIRRIRKALGKVYEASCDGEEAFLKAAGPFFNKELNKFYTEAILLENCNSLDKELNKIIRQTKKRADKHDKHNQKFFE